MAGYSRLDIFIKIIGVDKKDKVQANTIIFVKQFMNYKNLK